ncbi:hypothetical protein NPIL_578091 [Nephila pilipes]|uniref:Uncharacterized protein n=1 Tax=Nephila pilipes TaxID=299642 RepID=A0A8X6P9Z6_NEPPI|nr:hypothetical protein NPIL_578091 [Nephila pilipes]
MRFSGSYIIPPLPWATPPVRHGNGKVSPECDTIPEQGRHVEERIAGYAKHGGAPVIVDRMKPMPHSEKRDYRI